MTLEEIHRAVGKLNDSGKIDLSCESDQAAVVMLAATEVGTGVRKIVRFTGLPTKQVSKFVTRLRCNRIFRGKKIHCDWANPKEGGTAFICDVLVATGMLNRER